MKTFIKIVLLLLSIDCFGQSIISSPIIKDARKLYIDSLVYLYNINKKDTVVVFENEMPQDYSFPASCNFILAEDKDGFYKDIKFKRCYIRSEFNIENITDSTLIISFKLVREYHVRKMVFRKVTDSVGPIYNTEKNKFDYNEYCLLSYYMQFVYKYDCNMHKWILLPAKSYRNYPNL